MRSLGTFVLAAVALCASPIANAADMPSKAAPVNTETAHTWAGFYIGAQAGYGLGHSKLDMSGVGSLATFDQSGGVFGGRFGYNWQPNEWMVAGLVIDGDYLGNVKDSVSGAASKFSWMSTVRARAGLLLTKNLLVYGTGGLAFAKGSLSLGTKNTITTDDVRAGFVVGAGTEYRFNQHWSAFGEWTWADFGRNTQFIVLTERSDIHKFVGGIAYKF